MEKLTEFSIFETIIITVGRTGIPQEWSISCYWRNYKDVNKNTYFLLIANIKGTHSAQKITQTGTKKTLQKKWKLPQLQTFWEITSVEWGPSSRDACTIGKQKKDASKERLPQTECRGWGGNTKKKKIKDNVRVRRGGRKNGQWMWFIVNGQGG